MDAKLRQRTTSTCACFSLGWAAVLLSLLLGLGGCGGPASVTSLRRHSAYVYSSEVPAACETVYQRIARRAQERYRYTNRSTYQPGVTARIAPDGQSAAVTFFDAGGINLRYVLTADLHALDSDRTEVKVYAASRTAAPEALLWLHWAATPLASTPEPSARENGPQDANDAGPEAAGDRP
jgi:hypothetical protein